MLKSRATILLSAALLLTAAVSPAQTAGTAELRQFGAKADGRTDDSGAIVAALASLPPSGGTITIAPGTYLINQPIVPNRLFHMVCNGIIGPNSAGSCRILKSANFSGTALVLNASTRGSVIEGISIDGAPGNQGDGIQILANSIALRDVLVANQGGNGIYIGEEQVRDSTQANGFLLERVRSVKNKGNGYVIRKQDAAGPALPDANAGTMINCVAQDNAGDGLYIGKAVDDTFIGLLLETNLGYGLHITDSGEHTFIGGDFNENNRKGNVQIDSGTGMSSYFIGTDTGTKVVDNGALKSFFLNRSFGLTGGSPLWGANTDLAIGQAQVFSNNGAPAGNCRAGSLYLRSDGGPGTTLYVCERGHWVGK